MRKEEGKKRRKPARTTRRQAIRLSVIILSCAVLAFLAIYSISVNLKVLFDTETHITLSPTIKSITVPDKTTPRIAFTTTVDKLATCDVTCDHLLVDETNGKTVNETTTSKDKQDMAYNLPIMGDGEGQSAFTYTVTCTTTNRTLCPSKGKRYQRTAFVTVNYGLSAEEAAIKGRLQQALPPQASLLAQAHTTLQDAIALINALNDHADTRMASLEAAVLEKLLQQADDKERTLLDTWGQERYAESQALMEEHAATISRSAESIKAFSEAVNRTYQEYEEAANLTAAIHEQRAMASGWTGFLSRTAPATYASLQHAAEEYRNITGGNAPLEGLAERTQNITEAIGNARDKYIIGKATQRTAQSAIRRMYEPLLALSNRTWEGDGCDDYENIIAPLNTTGNDTSTIQDYLDAYCPELPDEQLFAEPPLPTIITEVTTPAQPTPVSDPVPQCCYRETCKPCDATPETPIILVHGHSFSKSSSPEFAFTRLLFLQTALAQDGYLDASTINADADIDDVPPGDWGKPPAPIVVGVTYYYLNYVDLGQLSFTTRKADSIETYAIRLKEAVETVQEKTGSDQVIIIAHSMGGLVARAYLQLFGDDNVEKLITAGTPNHGVQGDVRQYCTLTGAKQECEDMAAGSTFLKRLNDPKNQPDHAKVYTIRAIGCPTDTDDGKKAAGDGVVLADSVILDYAEESYVVQGECTDLFQTSLHMDFINPERYPETYAIIKGILEE